jgi:hypothetical protein
MFVVSTFKFSPPTVIRMGTNLNEIATSLQSQAVSLLLFPSYLSQKANKRLLSTNSSSNSRKMCELQSIYRPDQASSFSAMSGYAFGKMLLSVVFWQRLNIILT